MKKIFLFVSVFTICLAFIGSAFIAARGESKENYRPQTLRGIIVLCNGEVINFSFDTVINGSEAIVGAIEDTMLKIDELQAEISKDNENTGFADKALIVLRLILNYLAILGEVLGLVVVYGFGGLADLILMVIACLTFLISLFSLVPA